MYTLWCWCTPIQYDVHAYHSVMILSNALWCILVVDDAYTVHTEMMMMWIWLWGCIPYDDDAHLWWWCMMMHSLCSVKREHNYMMRCTMMYMSSVWKWNDLFVYMDDLQVKWLDGIRGWVGSNQSAEVTNCRFRVWFDRFIGWQSLSYMGGNMGKGKEVVSSFRF